MTEHRVIPSMPAVSESQEGCNLILIGFMGAGKSVLGKKAARNLNIPFLDTDRLIVMREGMTINEIFSQKGEPCFRNLETQVLRELMDREGSYVLSVGGGLPLGEENRALLKQLGCVIYLQTGVDTLEKRLWVWWDRPVLRQGEGTLREKITRILEKREPCYLEAADVVIVNDGKSISAVVKEITDLYDNAGRRQ